MTRKMRPTTNLGKGSIQAHPGATGRLTGAALGILALCPFLDSEKRLVGEAIAARSRPA
jgi:hypothetical protein